MAVYKKIIWTLLINAHILSGFDELWNTFPIEIKGLGKLWRGTGLLNENDQKRPGYQVWKDD